MKQKNKHLGNIGDMDSDGLQQEQCVLENQINVREVINTIENKIKERNQSDSEIQEPQAIKIDLVDFSEDQ